MHPNVKAALDAIAVSELGRKILAESDNGYNVLVGSTPGHVLTFSSYDDHPNILNQQLQSTAAGRYQLLHRYYVAYKEKLGLDDFSPASQDAIAVQQITERGAIDDLIAGDFETAVGKFCNIWASLPGAGYGQHENTMDYVLQAYQEAGGTLAP